MLIADLPPDPPAVPVWVSVSTERVDVRDGQHMGLIGLSYEREFGPDWRGGMAVYGASTGNRGGFFGWGLSVARQARWGDWHAEGGLFVGGGGGSPPWVGSGLMLRPYVELGYRIAPPLTLGLGWSQVRFPDGKVSSTQPQMALRWQMDSRLGQAAMADTPAPVAGDSKPVDVEFVGIGGQYQMSQSPRRSGLGDHGHLRYGGLAYRRGLAVGSVAGAQPYAVLTTLGAVAGGYDGFAELTGGLGMKWPLAPQWALRAEAAVGSAGAGATVDTGGGFIHKLGAAVEWRPWPAWSVGLHGGLVRSRGPFQARELRVALAWHQQEFESIGSGAVDASAGSSNPPAGRWVPWAVAASLQHFSCMQRDSGTARAAQILGLQLERGLDENWHLLARAGTGVGGQAGGYATGQLGVGWLTAPWRESASRVGMQASLGAAGGGGVQVSGGLFGEAQLLARLPLASDWALQFGAGQFKSARGPLSSPFVGVGVVSTFSRLQGR